MEKRIHLIFFDAGGGHRSAANALGTVIQEQGRSWQVEMVNLQELFDSLDVFRKVTGMRLQDIYNTTLRKGWTLGSPQLTRAMHGVIRLYHRQQVKLLQQFWRDHPTDLVVSLIPNFNRALFQSLRKTLPNVPLMTILTDLADFPPHFWIEKQEQYLVCGTDRAIQQARSAGYKEDRIFRTSGMIVNPKFYELPEIDRARGRENLGLRPDWPTGLVLFGGHGSTDMEDIAEYVSEANLKVQLIMLCGHNTKLARRLKEMPLNFPMHVEGFTREVPRFMKLSDFFVGKPGPGSISEALCMHLPVIVEKNAWTLPQERYNADWVQERGVGLVLNNFRDIVSAIQQLLQPRMYAGMQRRVKALKNRAVFEIPEMMATVMARAAEEPAAPQVTQRKIIRKRRLPRFRKLAS